MTARAGAAARGFLVAWLALAPPFGCKKDEPPENVLQPFPARYAGIGLELGMTGSLPSIVRVFPGTAADEAGLQPGDLVVEIDGVGLAGRSLADAVAGLRGEPGTRVTLTLRRASGGSEMVDLVRGEVARANGDGGRLRYGRGR